MCRNNRKDFELIAGIIPEGSKIMDLGCGNGDLMKLLSKKNIDCLGIEKDQEKVSTCISKKLKVYNLDFNECLKDLNDDSFDFVIMNNSFQETKFPETVINEALRIGKKFIIGFPNFAYYKARFQLLFSGRTPMTRSLPYEWYKTPNLRFLTIEDFIDFCNKKNITILKSHFFSSNKKIRFKPNLLARESIFLLKIN